MVKNEKKKSHFNALRQCFYDLSGGMYSRNKLFRDSLLGLGPAVENHWSIQSTKESVSIFQSDNTNNRPQTTSDVLCT